MSEPLPEQEAVAMEPFDPDERATAARMDQQYGGWAIWWGPGSRKLWGVPISGTAHVAIVSGDNPEELLQEMVRAEFIVFSGPPGWLSGPSSPP